MDTCKAGLPYVYSEHEASANLGLDTFYHSMDIGSDSLQHTRGDIFTQLINYYANWQQNKTTKNAEKKQEIYIIQQLSTNFV